MAAAAIVAGYGGCGCGFGRGSLVDAPATVTTLSAAQIDAGTAATPLLAFAKGTDVQMPRTLANPADPEAFLLAAMFAAQGYAVVAPDDLGYAKSSFSFRPYLHAESEATTGIDAVRAARNASSAVGASLSGKVMLAGCSQGGRLPGAAGETPTQARDAMFQPAFIADIAANPNNAVYLAGKKNDLLGWTPKAKVMLCGGAADPTVPPGIHRDVLLADFAARGVNNVSSVDVDPLVKATYGVNGAAPVDPTSPAFATYYGSYHGTYVPPFCHAQARAFFDTVK